MYVSLNNHIIFKLNIIDYVYTSSSVNDFLFNVPKSFAITFYSCLVSLYRTYHINSILLSVFYSIIDLDIVFILYFMF